MRSRSLARTAPRSQFLTTATVSRMLRMSPWVVRWLAREDRLSCEITDTGQHLFRESDVMWFNERLAKGRRQLVAMTRPGPTADGDARQLALFGRARLRLVTVRRDDSTSSTHPLITHARSGMK